MARGISIAALVLSIFVPIVGLIVGIVALRQERRMGESATVPIIAIVIGAFGTVVFGFIVFVAGIAAFGVFNPDRFVQERCVGEAAGLLCASNAVQADTVRDTVAFQLHNDVGERITITDVSSAGGDCSLAGPALFDGAAAPVTYMPGDRFIVTVSCDDVREGVVFQDGFVFSYDRVDGPSGIGARVEVVVKT